MNQQNGQDIAYQIRRSIFDGITFSFLLFCAYAVFAQPTFDDLIEYGHQTILVATMISLFVTGLISFGLAKANIKTLGEVIYAPAHRRIPGPPEPLFKTFWGVQMILVVALCLILGILVTEANLVKLIYDPNQDTDPFAPLRAAGRLFGELIAPDFRILARAMMAMVETIFVAFLATAIAVPLAFVLSFLTARNVMGQSLLGANFCGALRIVFNISRSIEPVLWAIIFSVWVGIGPFAGMLALMIHSIASLAKQYSEVVESVEDGPIEGIRSTGANALQTVWFAIVPQVILPYISFTIYRWDINVRMATILGLVGGGGIGKMLIEYQGQAQWNQVGTIIVVIAFVVWLMDAFSAHVRSAIK